MQFRLMMLLILLSSHAMAFTVTTNVNDKDKNAINRFVFSGFGCKGENHSPEVVWKDAPKDAKSFAVTMYDPNAPTGSGWWHWTLVNIPTTVNKLEENASADKTKLPKGSVEGRTDFGKAGYGGLCPPVGDKPHHYIITVHALKVPSIDVNGEASGAMVGFNLNANSIAKASTTFTYGR